MPTNPFGAGVRQWRRITETLRAASTTVLGKGELVVTDGGRAYVPDGTKQLKDLSPLVDAASVAATYATLTQAILGWAYAQSFRLVTATRDVNEAITTGSVVWPDGATGTFTTDTASTAFPGAIDAYHVTHVLNGTPLTVTQAAVTRDAGGAVTAQPALTVA
jgi:hypothetical protein